MLGLDVHPRRSTNPELTGMGTRGINPRVAATKIHARRKAAGKRHFAMCGKDTTDPAKPLLEQFSVATISTFAVAANSLCEIANTMIGR